MDTPTLHDFAADVALVMDKAHTGAAIVVGHAREASPHACLRLIVRIL